jgi:hypothetical protein
MAHPTMQEKAVAEEVRDGDEVITAGLEAFDDCRQRLHGLSMRFDVSRSSFAPPGLSINSETRSPIMKNVPATQYRTQRPEQRFGIWARAVIEAKRHRSPACGSMVGEHEVAGAAHGGMR